MCRIIGFVPYPNNANIVGGVIGVFP